MKTARLPTFEAADELYQDEEDSADDNHQDGSANNFALWLKNRRSKFVIAVLGFVMGLLFAIYYTKVLDSFVFFFLLFFCLYHNTATS